MMPWNPCLSFRKSYYNKCRREMIRNLLDVLRQRNKNAEHRHLDVQQYADKQEMIEGIEELSQTTVKEAMVPRIDVEFISTQYTFHDIVERVNKMGFSRYPVYQDTIDNIIGMMYAKDLLRVVEHPDDFSLVRLLRKVYFVPDSKKLDELLKEFKRRKIHIAVAVDEYGGVSGIICLEDILEMIVGDIQDEFDNETEDVVKISSNVYLCDARTPIDELNEFLGIELPDEDFETIGGFVFEQFGKIPENLEKVSYKNIDFVVQSISGHKINTVKLIINNA
jgi:CBS domain containing-hemolysin-like protein